MATIDQFFEARDRNDDILEVNYPTGSWAWENRRESESEQKFLVLCDSFRQNGVPRGTVIATENKTYTALETEWDQSKNG